MRDVDYLDVFVGACYCAVLVAVSCLLLGWGWSLLKG